MRDLFINSSTQHTLLLVVPFVFAALLRWARSPASAMLGGIVGGILLGPAVLGHLDPGMWDRVFNGGTEERAALETTIRRQEADERAAAAVGVDAGVLALMRAEHATAIEQAKADINAAQWHSQRPLRSYGMTLVALALFVGARRRTSAGTATPGTAASVGIWASLLPGGVVAACAFWFWDASPPVAVAAGACLAAGPWTLATWERATADRAEEGGASLMLRCGRVAWIVASCAAVLAGWRLMGASAIIWLAPLAALPFGWCLAPGRRKWINSAIDWIVIPSMVTCSIVLIDPMDAVRFWPILIILLLSGDGRWLGGMIGLLALGGRDQQRSMALAMPLVDAGVSQVCMVVLLGAIGALTPSLTIAIVFGGLMLEVSAPWRRRFALAVTPP